MIVASFRSEEVAANSVERLLRSTLFVGTDRSLVERCASSFALWRIGVGKDDRAGR
jgi:hypothetical protein